MSTDISTSGTEGMNTGSMTRYRHATVGTDRRLRLFAWLELNACDAIYHSNRERC